jgi:hypothetical protein
VDGAAARSAPAPRNWGRRRRARTTARHCRMDAAGGLRISEKVGQQQRCIRRQSRAPR